MTDAEMEGCNILGGSIQDGGDPPVQDGEPQVSQETPLPQPTAPASAPSLSLPPSPSPPLLPPPDTRPLPHPHTRPLPHPQPHSVPSFQPRAPPRGVWVRGGRSQRARGGRGVRGEIFEDPAVLKGIKVRPSLKSLDSAIVDCSDSSFWEQFGFSSWVPPPQAFKVRHSAKPILQQDDSIFGVIDRPAYGPRVPTYPHFLNKPRPYMPNVFTGRRDLMREAPPSRSFNHSWYSQMNPIIPRSPLRQRQPFAPQQQYHYQSCLTPQPLTPKMAQPRFGPLSPRPASLYSPSANTLHRFRLQGSVAQLHPQHKRLLSLRPSKPRRPERWDPYAKLMTDKEKEWVIRLQMIQLQSENPHLDDYYYQEYYKRLEAKLAEEEKRGEWTERENLKLTTPYVTKTESYMSVVHIEGSLGQVAVSTCYSPRRAIDAVRTHSPDEEAKEARQPRIDVHIEKLFSLLLEVEELERRKGRVCAEEKCLIILFSLLLEVEELERRKGRVCAEEKSRLLEHMERKVQQIYLQIRQANSPESNEEFLPCLLVSKGKRLLARLLPFLSHDAALHILTMVTVHLPILMMKDADEALPVLYGPLRDVISQLPFSELIRVLKHFTILDPEASETTLTLACQNEVGHRATRHVSGFYGL
ncbi:hypothetical protein ACEWY4_026425 [Coilia grayii]|uniref:mRNA decay factor PAT1 domain-containing protein n=1 Tax=Coilia grayii TaxID=363190 RepID=A0ABD1IUU1_9TELE